MKTTIVTLAGMLLVLATLSLAVPTRTEAKTASCYDTASSQSALTACADAELRANRIRVEAAYAALRRSLPGAERRAVEVDQSAWSAWAAANCKSASNIDLPGAGSMAPMVNLQCLAKRSADRAAYLRWRAGSLEVRQQTAMP